MSPNSSQEFQVGLCIGADKATSSSTVKMTGSRLGGISAFRKLRTKRLEAAGPFYTFYVKKTKEFDQVNQRKAKSQKCETEA